MIEQMNLFETTSIEERFSMLLNDVVMLDLDEKVLILNELKKMMHDISPFKTEPVDCVLWVKNDDVVANDYNPNKVAPPEMELLEVSIMNDGYTQPIVAWTNEEKGKTEVIDGFHRNRVGKESVVVRDRVRGYLPVVDIRKEQSGKNDRIASTIRHNRARGKHQVDAMSEIVIELKNRNWTNKRIAKQLGMDEEEVLRLCQVSGLENLFSDTDFTSSWEADDSIELKDFKPLTDDVDDEVMAKYRIPHENDELRVFHTYDKWECHKAGFYRATVEGKTKAECEVMFADFFKVKGQFAEALEKIIVEWKFSCEHYLTNKAMNRIAWLGQAAVCYTIGIPSIYCSGYSLLTKEEKEENNKIALIYLNKWLNDNKGITEEIEEALNVNRQVELY